MFPQPAISPNQPVAMHFPQGIELYIKREDLLHPFISGNKYRKLKYTIQETQRQGCKQLVTFGGAYSNHIAAVAALGKEMNFSTVGIIRGEELSAKWHTNPTLKQACECGMNLQFVSRSFYRENKMHPAFLHSLRQKWGDFYLIPEGGANQLGIKGCEEILTPQDNEFTIIACSVGTGTTLAGLINSAKPHQQVIGFSALKGTFSETFLRTHTHHARWRLVNDYHFGGYGKINTTLLTFINTFRDTTGIPLDPVYTGKMVYGIIDLIKKGSFRENSKILLIHTGGLQGIEGMNHRLIGKQTGKLATA